MTSLLVAGLGASLGASLAVPSVPAGLVALEALGVVAAPEQAESSIINDNPDKATIFFEEGMFHCTSTK